MAWGKALGDTEDEVRRDSGERDSLPRRSRGVYAAAQVVKKRVGPIRRELKTDCPVCGFQLAGNRFSGYRCVKCHSHFSARFIAQVRRAKFRELVDKHFGEPARASPPSQHAPLPHPPKAEVTEADDTIIVEDTDGRVERAIEEAHSAVRNSIQHLEEILERQRDEEAQTPAAEEYLVIEPGEEEREGIVDEPIVCVPVPAKPAAAATHRDVAPKPPGRVVRKLPNPMARPAKRSAAKHLKATKAGRKTRPALKSKVNSALKAGRKPTKAQPARAKRKLVSRAATRARPPRRRR